MNKNMKKIKIKIKDEIGVAVFDPKQPPDCARKYTKSMDDASGIFDYEEWQVGNTKVNKGDLILYTKYGINLLTTIVIPKDAIGKLIEIVE